MPRASGVILASALAASSLLLLAAPARAQFFGNPGSGVTPTAPLVSPTGGEAPQGNTKFTPKQIQQLYLLRYLQSRSGGGVKRGVPQFIPFGAQPFMGNMMSSQQATPAQQDPADAPDAGGHKSAAEMRADYEAAREVRRQKTRERAERREQEAAARRAAQSGAK